MSADGVAVPDTTIPTTAAPSTVFQSADSWFGNFTDTHRNLHSLLIISGLAYLCYKAWKS